MADAFKGLELLKQEVPANLVGKLPRVTCADCRKNQCQRHQKAKCTVCSGWLGQHMHLDYVGHAETTAQLLAADLAWNWEPVAFDANGLPAFDADGGLWIKLTVCGVTRLGYGTADNANGFKSRGDIRKEIIGDALRNAAMRFGWALNLWAKTDIHERAPQEEHDSAPSGQAQRSKGNAPETDPWATASPATATPSNGGERPKPNQKIARIIGHAVTTTNDLTFDEAKLILVTLANEQLFLDLQAAILGAADPPSLGAVYQQVKDAFGSGRLTQEQFHELDQLGEAAAADLAKAAQPAGVS
jgi:hypothetical protein